MLRGILYFFYLAAFKRHYALRLATAPVLLLFLHVLILRVFSGLLK